MTPNAIFSVSFLGSTHEFQKTFIGRIFSWCWIKILMDPCVKFLFGRDVTPNIGYNLTCLPCVMSNWSNSWRLPCGSWNPMWVWCIATFPTLYRLIGTSSLLVLGCNPYFSFCLDSSALRVNRNFIDKLDIDIGVLPQKSL